jgi:sulfate transport system ATP-binding protein
MIRLTGVTKSLGASQVLRGIDMDFTRGEFTALLGRSGSGKTSLLRLLAGLEQPHAGQIEIEGHDATFLPPGQRQIGFVFQSYALFGHMSVFENIAFGLRVRPRRQRPPEAEIRARVEDLLAMIRLDGLGPRLPAQLSGGQRQRVALARALAIEPRILLLDEPFGALDREVREELRLALREVHNRLGLTTIFVTHDEEEAQSLADRIVVLEAGKIVADTRQPLEFPHGPLQEDAEADCAA